MRTVLGALVVGVTALYALPATAEPGATATLSHEVIEAGDRLQYRVEARSSGDEIRLTGAPELGKFQVLGRQQMPSIVSINGVVERKLTLIYSISSSTVGTHTIAPPTFRIGDRDVKANPVTVRVLAVGTAPTPKKRARGDDRFMIEAVLEPDNRKPYIGEQITLRYFLYFSQQATPTHAREPSLDDFWIEELTERLPRNDRTVTIDGRAYRRSPMWSYALFPLRTGELEIEPASVDLGSIELFQRSQSIATATSESILLDVQPLPDGAPAGFADGNVGNWAFKVRTLQPTSKVGETFSIELSATGSGQVNRVRLPQLPALEGTRVSDVNSNTSSNLRGTTVGGTASTTYTIMPLTEGKITIPAMTFHWFDPAKREYRTKTSEPIVIDVQPGTLPADRPKPVARATTADEDLIANLGEQLQPLRDAPSLEPARDPARFPWPYWLLIAAAFLTLLIVSFGDAVRAALRRATPQREQRNRAAEAIEAVEQATDAAALTRALTTGLHDAWGIPRGAVTSTEVERAFARNNLDPQAGAALAEVLAECEAARFAPTGAKLPSKTTARAVEALRAIATVLTVLFAVWAASAPAAAFAQDEQIVDVQYNLGTEAALAGDYGAARLALERAAYLSPWDDDIETNRSLVERIVRLQIIERSRTGRTPEGDEVLFWWRAATRVNPHVIAILTILLWLAAAAAVHARRRATAPAVRDTLAIALAGAVLLAVVATVAVIGRSQVLASTSPIVVLSDNLDLREGPNAAAKRMRTPPTVVAGTMLRIEDERGEWVKISWNTDSGWARRENVGEVVPPR